jgi:hypothetical protein
MVTVSITPDEFGGLVCSLRDESNEGVVRATNPQEAAADLTGALDNVAQGLTGECFWLRESGDYRWLIKRTGDKVRLVVLWCTGAMTGWENVFWADTEWPALESALRAQLAALAVAAS